VFGFVLPGMFSSVHVQALRTVSGVWRILTGGYYALPAALFVFLWVMWLVALIRSWKLLLRDPLRRVIILGPVVGIASYVMLSPQAEVRYVFPAFAPLFVAASIALLGGRGATACAVLATVSVWTCFIPEQSGQILTFAIWGAIVALVGLPIRWMEADYFRMRGPWITIACVAGLFLVLLLRWSSYVGEYRAGRFDYWAAVYEPHAQAWRFVDENVPDTATLAYSNQYLIYPLYGFNGRRRVVYVPVRAGETVSSLVLPDRLIDSEFYSDSLISANSPAVWGQWRANLRVSGAEYLFVGVDRRAPELGPEVGWAEGDPGEFTKVFANEEAAVYRIHLKD
jgi:hypothetical protein